MKKTQITKRINHIMLGIMTFAFICLMSLVSIVPKNIAKATGPSDSSFLYEPVAAASIDDTIYALDTNMGKVIKIVDGEIDQSAASSYQTRTAKDLQVVSDFLVLISPESAENKFTVLSPAYENQIISDSIDLDEYEEEYDNFSVITAGNSVYSVFYNNAAENGMLFVELNENSGAFSVADKRTISINTEWQDDFDNALGLVLCFDSAQNAPFGLIITPQNAVRGFYLDSANISSLTAPNASFVVPEGENLFSTNIDGNNFIMYKNNSTLRAYSCTMSSGPLSLDIDTNNFAQSNIALESLSNIFISNGKACLVSKTNQQIEIKTSSVEANALTLTNSTMLSNPEINVEYMDSKDVTFNEIVSSEAKMVALPYSTEPLVLLPRETKVVMIGKGYMEVAGNQEEIQGYQYFMATVAGTNYYGFIEIDDTYELEVDSNPAQRYVFIRAGAKIYKYPSRTIDTINTLTQTITSNKKFELNSDIQNYSYTAGSSTYTFVQVLLDNNQVGYIESSYVQNDAAVLYVQTNASLIRTSNVYLEPDSNSTIIMSLNQTKRVRIIENRAGNEHYTKVAFNDELDNYYEGYILSENIKADSWSTLQIIGFVLITFSILFLAVILIIKNKIIHE